MVGYLQGKVLSLHPDSLQCTLLAGDVGYELHLTRKTFDSLKPQQFVMLWIHSHVREDAFILYAFPNEMEKHFFRILLNVQGLGPKTALALISEHGVERLTRLVLQKNSTEISSAQGVGKKLAERLILELGNKLEKISWLNAIHPLIDDKKAKALSPQGLLRDDLASALANLGFTPGQIKLSVDRLFEDKKTESLGFESILKIALKELSGRTLTTPSEGGGHG